MTFPISRQGLQDIALFLIAGAVLFAVLALLKRRRGEPWRRFGMSSGILGVLVSVCYSLAFTVAPNIPTPAVPLTARFAQNPTPDTAETIDRGRGTYQASCAICHGPLALGDGPAAFTLTPRPFNLQLHVPLHAPGEVYHWITNGVPGTGMPAWQDTLSDTQRWEIVRYLEALSAKKIDR